MLEIKNDNVILPVVSEENYPVWHIFAIRSFYRELLENCLNEAGIGTNKHYPIPIHLQDCYSELGYKQGDFPVAEEISRTELSLPIYYGMTEDEISYIIATINGFRV